MIPNLSDGSRIYGVPGAVGRVFTVLYALTGGKCLSFGELERACDGVAKATLVRLLKTLRAAGLIDKRADGRYILGAESFYFARAVLQQVSRSVLISPVLKSLADLTGESAAFFEFDDLQIKLLNKVEMSDSFHYIPVGRVVRRLDVNVFARMMLAFSEESFAREVLAKDEFTTEQAGCRDLNLYSDLRVQEIYIGAEESGVPISRVVAPVLGVCGTAIGSIGITLLGEHVKKSRLLECRLHVQDAVVCAQDVLNV